MATPLLEVTRGPVVESRHYGAIAVVDAAGKPVAGAGDTGLIAYLRSAAKPLQALPLVASGAAARFAFTPEELAICAGSHNGEPAHRAVVRGVLDKLGLAPSALRCGIVPSGDRREAAEIALGLREVDQLYHGCSGKHAGMLAACVHRDYPLETYTAPDHPLQREILRVMGEFHHLPERAIAVGVDGCGVPTFAMPLVNIARAFATLAAPPTGPYAEAAGRVLDAMAAHPFMVAGSGRLCTDLMALAGGRVIAKTGAEGLLCLALRDCGWGVAIKVEDGNPRGLARIAAALLAQLGILDEGTIARFAALHPATLLNVAGAPVGELRPVFSLD